MSDAPITTTKTEEELTLDQLRTTNEELQRRRADAEKDKELFRELYGKASAHVSEVTKENNELLDRVAVLETQVSDGLTMIRNTYSEHVKKLQEEVEKWKQLHDVLATRDARTNGEEIRRRAAAERELREENQRLRQDLELLRVDYERMETVFEQFGEEELSQLPAQEEDIKQTVRNRVPLAPQEIDALMMQVALPVS